ncbi:hypothetical protein KQH61_06035 [bacterium]|nr:hypothetical protein [bacterium]
MSDKYPNPISEKMGALLTSTGATHKSVHVFGSQCHITAISRESAEKAAQLLIAAGWQLRAIIETVEENKVNTGTVLNPTMHKVYLAGLYLPR